MRKVRPKEVSMSEFKKKCSQFMKISKLVAAVSRRVVNLWLDQLGRAGRARISARPGPKI